MPCFADSCKIFGKILKRPFSFSIVGSLNRTLGGIIGGVKGIVFAVIFCLIISLIVSFSGKPFLIFTAESIHDSIVYKIISNYLPIR
ncbi:MAG: CvpA family protein [Clostridia bacterium]|nr:CvpA family protein [Clostridia bacterium]